jgi:hypothetical protein
MSRSYTSSPPSASMACSGTALLYFYSVHGSQLIRWLGINLLKDEMEAKVECKKHRHGAEFRKCCGLLCFTLGTCSCLSCCVLLFIFLRHEDWGLSIGTLYSTLLESNQRRSKALIFDRNWKHDRIMKRYIADKWSWVATGRKFLTWSLCRGADQVVPIVRMGFYCVFTVKRFVEKLAWEGLAFIKWVSRRRTWG